MTIAEALRRRARNSTRPTVAASEPTPIRGGGPLGVLGVAIAFGLATGLLEVAILVGWHQIDGSSTMGALQMNRHFAWMIPLAYLATSGAMGLVAAGVAAIHRGAGRRLAVTFGVAALVFGLGTMVKGVYPLAVLALAAGAGWRGGGWIARRWWEGLARATRWGLPAMVAISAGMGLWSYDREVLAESRSIAALPPVRGGKPNVLLIVLDTVRADALIDGGSPRSTTPNLSRLAARGVRFDRARSAAPWTLPTHASLFTGRWPRELGIGENRPLDGSRPTLAEYLSGHGYATSGFVGNTYFCNSWFGLGRGFAHYEDYYEENLLVSPVEALRCTAAGRAIIRWVGSSYNVRPESVHAPKDAERINRDFLRWLDAHREASADRPFFTFLNYIDAHDPYLVPAGSTAPRFGLIPESEAELNLLRGWHAVPKGTLTPRQATLARDAYDDCLAALDAQIGRLLDELERRGVLDETIVVLTSDHGEQFGDRNLFGHGSSLYRPEVHVPLIISPPRGRAWSTAPVAPGSTVARPASLRDVAATVVDAVGLAEGSPFPGRSLARLWGGPDSTAVDEPILSEVAAVTKVAKTPVWPPAHRGPMAAIVLGDRLYIRDALGGEELYDPIADPDERTNLAARPGEAPALERCRAALDGVGPPRR